MVFCKTILRQKYLKIISKSIPMTPPKHTLHTPKRVSSELLLKAADLASHLLSLTLAPFQTLQNMQGKGEWFLLTPILSPTRKATKVDQSPPCGLHPACEGPAQQDAPGPLQPAHRAHHPARPPLAPRLGDSEERHAGSQRDGTPYRPPPGSHPQGRPQPPAPSASDLSGPLSCCCWCWSHWCCCYCCRRRRRRPWHSYAEPSRAPLERAGVWGSLGAKGKLEGAGERQRGTGGGSGSSPGVSAPPAAPRRAPDLVRGARARASPAADLGLPPEAGARLAGPRPRPFPA